MLRGSADLQVFLFGVVYLAIRFCDASDSEYSSNFVQILEKV
jgi:hypothetical protein